MLCIIPWSIRNYNKKKFKKKTLLELMSPRDFSLPQDLSCYNSNNDLICGNLIFQRTKGKIEMRILEHFSLKLGELF